MSLTTAGAGAAVVQVFGPALTASDIGQQPRFFCSLSRSVALRALHAFRAHLSPPGTFNEDCYHPPGQSAPLQHPVCSRLKRVPMSEV